MMSIAITALLLVTVAALFLYGVKADREGTFFMSKDFTTTMNGLAAIVVVFVHFPTEYQNKLQDLVGSFAYVAVTVFFLFSAYGMLLSVDRNERYLKTFWINRIAGLVVPNWMVNFALAAIIFLFASKSVEMDNVFQLNTYVWVLLGYCVVFYLVELMSKRYKGDEGKKDIHEKNEDFLKKCRNVASYCAKALDWNVVLCSEKGEPKTIEEIANEVYSRIEGEI